MIDIFKTIREERQDFLQNEIEVVPGYNFSQYETVKKIHLYFNSHYVDGDYEEINGVTKKKIFHNINAWRCEVATKMLDIDTKDFRLIGDDKEKDIHVLLLEKELKLWLKRHELGQKLNQIVEELPIYGSVVLEKVKDGVQLVDLRYLYNDQAAESLEKARYINIKHIMSVGELRKMKGKWDNVEEAIERFAKKDAPGYDVALGTRVFNKPEGSPQVEIFKRYGEVPLSWFTDKEKDNDEYVLAKFVVAGVDGYVENEARVITDETGVILYKEQLKELPLKEVHYTKTKGRWLGKGVVEKTFEDQRRINEIKNQKAKAMEVGALNLLQTRDQTIQSNVDTDTVNGQILVTKSPLEAVPTELRDMSSFDNEALNVDQHADRETFSYDAVRGEAAPASATLGSIQIQEQQASSAFSYKKENIELFVREYIKDIVFPELEKDLNKEHTLRFMGSLGELKKIREKYARAAAPDIQIQELLKTGKTRDIETIVQELVTKLSENGDKEWIKVQKDFFRGLDYQVDLVVGNENKNIFADLQNAQAVLGALSADPMLLQDPAKRTVFFMMLSDMGMHLSKIEEIQSEIANQPLDPMTGQPMQQMQQMMQQAPQV